jgi:hypothetical protein
MYHLEAHSGSGDPDQLLPAIPFANTQQKECRILHPTPHSITSIISITSIANLGDFDDAFSTTHKQGSDASHYSITSLAKTSPPSIFSQAGDPGQIIEQEQLTALLNHLCAKQQKVVLLEFEKQKHKEQNKTLQEKVITLQTCISKKDNCYNEVIMARDSLQTEIDLLLRKNTEFQEEKAELIQQKKQLQEEVTALHTSINQKDDSYNKMMLTRTSLQTQIDILNKTNIESQEEKAELIQQKSSCRKK